MDKNKKEQLEANGWVETTVQDFLELTDEEAAYIEMKLNLSQALRERRLARGLSQKEFAALVRSSQSRVSKMENGDPSISMDLLVRSLLALEATKEELAEAIAA